MAGRRPAVFTKSMNAASLQRTLIRTIRLYPLIAAILLGVAYLLGGFSDRADPLVPKDDVVLVLKIFIGIVPVLITIFFLLINSLHDRESKARTQLQGRFAYTDAFSLPNEKMHGYKLSYISGRIPSFTGLTGDLYSSDDVATCSVDSSHVPPVIDCECGFYAFKNFKDALFELSINPGAFLIDVDLYGVGFEYARGYKAESQVVNSLKLPKRCMRCKVLPIKQFVTTYKMGLNSYSFWKWEVRCAMCCATFKAEDVVGLQEMGMLLKTSIK